jgi:hypothetical protein
MQKKTIKITVDTDSLIDFFGKDPTGGTASKPLVADDFCKIDAPDIKWEGNKILPLEADTEYVVTLVSNSKKYPVTLYDKATGDINGEINMDLITPTITKKKEWGEIFDLDRTKCEATLDGHLIVKPTKDDNFSVFTPEKIKLKENIFYLINFKIGGADKMAVIDPIISNKTDPDD